MSIPGKNEEAGKRALAASGAAYYGSDPIEAAASCIADILEATRAKHGWSGLSDSVLDRALELYEGRA